jgi:hypothetical protein
VARALALTVLLKHTLILEILLVKVVLKDAIAVAMPLLANLVAPVLA